MLQVSPVSTRKTESKRSSQEPQAPIDSGWDVVDDLPLRWATDYVPLAVPGSRLMNASVLTYALWRNDDQPRGSALLAVAIKSAVLLYESPRGERAFRFIKVSPPQKKNLIEYMTSTMKFSLLHSGILHSIACPWPHVCLPEPPRQPLSEPFGHHRHRATPVATALARARARIAAQHASAPSVTHDGGAEPATEPLRRLREKSGAHPPRQLGRGRNHALRGTGLPKPARPGPLLVHLLVHPLPHLRLRVALGPPFAHLPRRVRPGEGQPWRVDAPRQARPPHHDQRNYPYDRDTRGHVGHRHHRRHRLQRHSHSRLCRGLRRRAEQQQRQQHQHLHRDARQTVLRAALSAPGQSPVDGAPTDAIVALAPDLRLTARDRYRVHKHRHRRHRRRRRHEQQQQRVLLVRLDVDGGSTGSNGNGTGTGTGRAQHQPAAATTTRPAADGVWRGRSGDTGGAALVAFRERQGAVVALRGAGRV